MNSNLPQDDKMDRLIVALAGIGEQLGQLSDKRIETEWMDIEETATYLKTKKTHIRDLVYKREIPYSKLGALLRFHRPTLDRWLLTKKE